MLHVARRLMVLAHNPEFGFQDDAEIHGRDPLRGIRMNLGGRNLASRALYTAVQAYRRAVTGDPAIADAELAMDMLLLGEAMLRSDDDAEAAIGRCGRSAGFCALAAMPSRPAARSSSPDWAACPHRGVGGVTAAKPGSQYPMGYT